MIASTVKRLLIASLLLAGCASTYTGLHKNDDGSYFMTKTAQGFFRVAGTLYHCTFQGEALNCVEIDTP